MKPNRFHHAMLAPKRALSRGFADRLVHRLGLSGAIWACRENHWTGVKREIERRHDNFHGPENGLPMSSKPWRYKPRGSSTRRGHP